MIGAYWAQPDYQRITWPHEQIERTGMGIGPCRKPKQERPERIGRLVEVLKTGPKSTAQLRKDHGFDPEKLAMLLVLATTYEQQLWEVQAMKPGRKGHMTFYGLGENCELPDGYEVII